LPSKRQAPGLINSSGSISSLLIISLDVPFPAVSDSMLPRSTEDEDELSSEDSARGVVVEDTVSEELETVPVGGSSLLISPSHDQTGQHLP